MFLLVVEYVSATVHKGGNNQMLVYMGIGDEVHILEEEDWGTVRFDITEPGTLAFDQSSNCTGLAYGNQKDKLLLSFALKRQHSKERNVAEYKQKVMAFLEVFMKGKNITNIECEQIYSKNEYYNSFEVLAQIKGMFQDLEYKLGYSVPVNFRQVQSWRTRFCTTKEGKSYEKEDVVTEVLRRHPEFYRMDMPVDTYEAIGILYAYLDHFAPKIIKTTSGKSIPIQQINKTMAREKRHNNTVKCFSARGIEDLMRQLLQDKELNNIREWRGMGIFKFENSLTLEENIRALTSNSNLLWIGEIPENSIYFSSVLWKYNIKWREGDSIWIACYRNKQTVERIAMI